MASAPRFAAGQSLGQSDWMLISQTDIDVFGAATRDLEPLHNDPNWCAENSPYGVPIAYGFQTLSYLTHMMHVATDGMFSGAQDKEDFPLNSGFDRVRLITPVRVGDKIRGLFNVESVEQRKPGELRVVVEFEVQIKNSDRPAAVGQWVYIWVTGEGTASVGRSVQNDPNALEVSK